MPTILDVFNGDAFSSVEMTEAINMLPYQPQRLGSMGLFEEKGVATTVVGIERKGNKLALVPTRDRGVVGVANPTVKRDIRNLTAVHLPIEDAILADDLIGVREFGSTDRTQAINTVVNDKMEEMKNNIETTKEYHRVGAIQGQVKDADGSTTILNLFTEFGFTETVVDFALDVSTTDVKAKAASVRRQIEGQAGGMVFRGIHVMCGDAFWDALVAHDEVKAAFDRKNDGQFLREDQRMSGGFEFAGMFWENYRGQIGDVKFIPTDDCRFIPLGVKGLFKTWNAPANWVEAVGTIGKPFYAKQSRMKNDVGIELTAQANPLTVCTRPNLLVRGTRT